MRFVQIKKQIQFIDECKKIEWDFIKSVQELIMDSDIICLSKKRNNKKNEIGFNVFQIVSETYYRENFHSYLIYNLLSQSYHSDGNKFLNIFIKCLNSNAKKKIKLENFENPTVEREKDNIDIRIRDNNSKKSIIIENKMNDAIDQPKQIPRYCENEKEDGFDVSGIVYLSLNEVNESEKPDKKDWTDDEKKMVDELIIYLNSSKNSKVNLIRDWINQCIATSNSIDVISTLRQYKEILKHLRLKKMNQEIIKKFYEQIKEKEKYSTALSIREMLNGLNEYRAMKIEEDFSTKATSIFKCHSNIVYKFKGNYRAIFKSKNVNIDNVNIDFNFEIVILDKKTEVYIWEDSTYTEDIDNIKKILIKIDELDFKQNVGWPQGYFKVFLFPEEEDDLYPFIDSIFEKFKKI